MVLAFQVGRRRPFWRGFLLTVITFGIYSFYWDYKAHDELYKQFELAREERDEGVVWYILGFILPVLRFAYYYHFVANVRYLRQRMRHDRILSPGAFLSMVIVATTTLAITSIVAAIMASAAVTQDEDGDLRIDDQAQFNLAAVIVAGGTLAFLVLQMVAYYRLQSGINAVWESYQGRAAQLRGWIAPGAPAAATAATAPARVVR